MSKGWRRCLFFVAFFIGVLLFPTDAKRVMATQGGCVTYSGNNIEAQNYANNRWASTVKSYLSWNGDGLMRVQAGGSIEGVAVEYYDLNYNLLGNRLIAKELPIFGGFFERDTNYFLVTGQNNPKESEDVEVIRITKYDKDWKRISSTGIYDCNTTVPFHAGSLRMAQIEQYLLIRTSHQMYRSKSDGKNHQANMTIQLDMKKMKVTDSYTDVQSIGYGYVSHSFNQFIAIENGKIVALDHGDAYPRSLVLIKYATDVMEGKFTSTSGKYCTAIDVLKFPGSIGNNTTGASVGGFAVGKEYYLTAGNSVIQDGNNTSRRTNNIFVAAVSKESGEVLFQWLTEYEEGDGTTSTPHLVKVSEEEYIVLWSRANTIYYTKVDESGRQLGAIYQMEGNLSDCVPVVAGDRLIWYTWRNDAVSFYDISISDLARRNVTKVQNGHKYVNSGVDGGFANLVCSVCGTRTRMRVPDTMKIFWLTEYHQEGWTSWSTDWKEDQEANTKLAFKITMEPSVANNEIEVLVSDDKLISFEEAPDVPGARGCLAMKRAGDVTVTIRSRYNPELSETFSFHITGGEEIKNGLFPAEDGRWYYYIDGQIARHYTGLIQNNTGWWYVQNGSVNFEYTGLAWDPAVGWWYVQNGAIDFGKIGLVENEFGWWYVYGGGIVFDYTGLAENESGWWRVENGTVNFDYTGLAWDPFVGWWYVRNGSVDFGKTGLVENEFGCWFVSGGSILFDYTGLVSDGQDWWRVENGAVDMGYTGLAWDSYVGWWYVENGAIDFSYSGSAIGPDGRRYLVEGGKVVF